MAKVEFAPSPVVVANLLREELLEQRLEPGSYVGSEDDLLGRYGVSRPTLRQAVRILELEGLLTVRRGTKGGFFASAPTTEAVSRVASTYLRSLGVGIEEITAAGRMLAPVMAGLAAQHPSPAERRRLLEFVVEYQARPRVDEERTIFETIRDFGAIVNSLIDNQVLRLFSSVVGTISSTPLGARPFSDPSHIDLTRQYHLRIARAVADGDADEASAARAELQDLAIEWVADAVHHP